VFGNYLFNFVVEDTGVGITPEAQSSLFKKFSQGDASTSRKFGGTGLGLSISKSLAEMMGGQISFESKIGTGSKFMVSLPLKKAETEVIWDDKIQNSLRKLQSARDFTNCRVLIADDHPVNMLFATKLLRKMGFTRIDEAANGIEALEKFENQGKQYDLVLMDCQMPEMDGFEVTRRIREKEKTEGRKGVPIIAMTAHAMEGDRDLCIQAGMNDYISKPVNPDKLHEVLYRWLLKEEDNKAVPREEKNNSDNASRAQIINIAHLELFTDGDLDQEKILSDAFVSVGEGSLKVMKDHLAKMSSNDDWNMAAHKLKGSSAQIGADNLSAWCLKAENVSGSILAEKESLLANIEEEFMRVKTFFEDRQK
jgi:CheY-like chemotaxis protein